MTSPSQRWATAVAIALLAGAVAPGARAESFDAGPLGRPGVRTIEASAAPRLGAAPLKAAEPALARIGFDPGGATLSQSAAADLESFVRAFGRRAGRMTLKSYAGEIGDTSTTARRLSLKRVLAVRDFLIERGISAERLDVRALGGARDAGPLDRVDITRGGG